MTATKKQLNEQLRALREEWRDWRYGRTNLHWYGMVTWCEAGAAGRCTEPTCEGCAWVVETRWQLAQIEAEVKPLKAQLEKVRAAKPVRRKPARPAQEALFA